MVSHQRRFLLATATAVLSLAMTACMAAGPAKVGGLQGEGPYQQFIVKYRDGSAPAREEASVQARLDRTVGASGLKNGGRAVALERKLRLSVAADVFRADRPLSKVEAQRLMQAFAADPDVEYIEIDGVVTTMPVGGSPVR